MFNKKNRRTSDMAKSFSTQIGTGTVFEGKLNGSGNHSIAGTVIGNCNLDEIIRIEDGGNWQGDIAAGAVIIAGKVKGNINAREKIELLATARITGNLAAPAIAIAEGATLEGKINTPTKKNITHYRERRGTKKDNEQD